MPLRDHFRPPLTRTSTDREVHGQWPAVWVQQLGRLFFGVLRVLGALAWRAAGSAQTR